MNCDYPYERCKREADYIDLDSAKTYCVDHAKVLRIKRKRLLIGQLIGNVICDLIVCGYYLLLTAGITLTIMFVLSLLFSVIFGVDAHEEFLFIYLTPNFWGFLGSSAVFAIRPAFGR